MKGVNFLRAQREKIKRRTKRLFIVQISSLLLLLIYGLVVIGVFAFYFISKKEGDALNKKISSQRNKIEQAVDVETKQVYLKNKADNLINVFENARNHQLLIEGLFSLLPEGISIRGFDVAQTEEIRFQGRAVDFASLERLFENVKKGKLTEEIPLYSAYVGKVSLLKEGGFSFELSLYLKRPSEEG